MGRVLACASVLALVATTPAAAALPRAGALVPGRSLGGVRLGEPAAQVRTGLGGFYGVCRGCARPTWYFTYRPFDEHGLGVELTGGRVSAVYTLWQPPGWHGPRGLRLGAVEAQVTALAGTLLPVSCGSYEALVRDDRSARTRVLPRGREALGLRPPPPARDPLPLMLELEDVRAAARLLHGVAHRTPVLTSRTLDERTGAEVHVKAESFQRGGAFKFRGAYTKLASLPEETLRRGVLAYSSGNHAQAVAIAAGLLGGRATILMPADAPAAKVEATRGYGAEVVSYDRWTESREEIGARLAAERGLELVKPYDDPLVMAGQGTTALELLEDAPELDLLVVPVGGGGLAAGCATAAKGLHPGIRVAGVEPEAGDDTRRSLETGARVRIEVPRTIADGLQATEPGELTFEVNRRRLDEVVTVSDAEILETMAFLFDRLKLVAEPSGAVGVAALLAGKLDASGRRVGVVVSGGNVGASRFAALLGGA